MFKYYNWLLSSGAESLSRCMNTPEVDDKICLDWFCAARSDSMTLNCQEPPNAFKSLSAISLTEALWGCSSLRLLTCINTTSLCAFSKTHLRAINYDVRLKRRPAGKNSATLWRSMWDTGGEWIPRCLQRAMLSLYSVFKTSAEKWAAGKYCFCTGAKRKVQSRQMRKWRVYLPQPHTHTQIHSKEEACCQSPYLSLLSFLSFPSWVSSPEDMCASSVNESLRTLSSLFSLL